MSDDGVPSFRAAKVSPIAVCTVVGMKLLVNSVNTYQSSLKPWKFLSLVSDSTVCFLIAGFAPARLPFQSLISLQIVVQNVNSLMRIAPRCFYAAAYSGEYASRTRHTSSDSRSRQVV